MLILQGAGQNVTSLSHKKHEKQPGCALNKLPVHQAPEPPEPPDVGEEDDPPPEFPPPEEPPPVLEAPEVGVLGADAAAVDAPLSFLAAC